MYHRLKNKIVRLYRVLKFYQLPKLIKIITDHADTAREIIHTLLCGGAIIGFAYALYLGVFTRRACEDLGGEFKPPMHVGRDSLNIECVFDGEETELDVLRLLHVDQFMKNLR